MERDLPHHLVVEVQKYTNAPWWNGKAYDEYHGLSSKLRDGVGDAIDDIADVIEMLRKEKVYFEADRLRTICGRLARLRPDVGESDLLRDRARGWK